MSNFDIFNALATTPEEAKKTIGAGRLKGFTDINPMWRIKKLTEVFGPCGIGWWYDITDRRLEQAPNGEIKCFVSILLFYRWNDIVSMPIPGFGGSSFLSHERNGDYVSDECEKMALTDAIGSACKALGMSADVYFSKDRSKYTDTPEQSGAASKDPRNNMIVELEKQVAQFAQLRGGTKENVLVALCNSQNVNVNPGTPLSDWTLDQLQKANAVLAKWIRKAHEG